MDRVNIVFDCLIVIEEEICRGNSLQDAALAWLVRAQAAVDPSTDQRREYERDFLNQFATVVRCFEEERPLSVRQELGGMENRPTQYREQLFLLLEAGRNGAAVLPEWRALKKEVENQLELDIKSHVESLPMKMLIPLLCFLFPAFLILLFGPITRAFLEVMR